MHATLTELIDAYKTFVKDNPHTLRRYASLHIRGTSFCEPEDLIQETLTRAFEGSRKWPLCVPFGLFMCLTMRSVAEGDRSQRAHLLFEPLPPHFRIDQEVADTSAGSSIEHRLITQDRLRVAARAVSLARRALGDDPEAQAVIDGILWGAPPRDTRSELGASERGFNAARQRAERRLREARDAITEMEEAQSRHAEPCEDVAASSRASSRGRRKPLLG